MLRDRLTGQLLTSCPSAPAWFGRWIFELDGEIENICLNNVSVEQGDAVVPGATNQWVLSSTTEAQPTRGSFYKNALPDDQDIDALRQLRGILFDEENPLGGWIEWSRMTPLAPGLSEATHAHPLEEYIEQELAHLAEVCQNPSTHIQVESERVPIARARRTDPRAISYLAAHSEDWGHRTLTGIRPRRVLAQIREEDWNLYENRVTVRLIDQLVAWLRRRIGQLRRVLRDIFLRLNDQEAVVGSRHRQKRIYTLWGEGFDANEGRELTEQAIARLEGLLYRLLGLMNSELYTKIPRRAQASRTLRMTNLLSNDDHYRGVARLWHQWASLSGAAAESSQQLWTQHQELHRGFIAWSTLLVVRACQQLGLEPQRDDDRSTPLTPGANITLDQDVDFVWSDRGTIELRRDDNVLVRFVPLAHCFETSQELSQQLNRLREATCELDTWTVVLHPASPDEQLDEIAGIGHPPLPAKHGGALDFIRVSPFSLDSVERVARAVRWAVLAPRMLSYPPPIEVPDELEDPLSNIDWIRRQADGAFALVRPCEEYEVESVGVMNTITDARIERERLKEERDTLDEQLRDVRGDDRRATSELNQRRRALLKPLREAEEREERLEGFELGLQEGRALLSFLSTCPVCDCPADFEPRQNGSFRAICTDPSCGASWYLEVDQEGGNRLPYLFPGDANIDDLSSDDPPQRVDELWGGDVLTVPQEA